MVQAAGTKLRVFLSCHCSLSARCFEVCATEEPTTAEKHVLSYNAERSNNIAQQDAFVQ